MNIEQQKYPAGKFVKPESVTPELMKQYLMVISGFPSRIRKEVQDLTEEQLDTPYRAEGWTIRQVVNHCADSHMNSLMRLKLALTENNPVIKPYFEDKWAELPDSKNMPVESALKMLEGIHERWSVLIKNLSAEQMKRTFFHPENRIKFRVDENIGLYAWHCDHHLAHITRLKNARGWD
ncbi:MAG: putative metal-dependent hydrolase [Bacteroidetes bacterium]|nr:putative metal-dependent hydrolase [Bacteroidota bacterium]